MMLLLGLFLGSILLSLWSQPPKRALISNGGFMDQIGDGIGLIELSGPLSFEMGNSGFNVNTGVDAIIDEIQLLSKDDAVKGLLIRVNSPGGTVGAAQELYHAIRAFKEEKEGAPVVASIGDMGASGAYYAAMAADAIYANPGSLVGSIGVIMGNIKLHEFGDKYGVGFEVYKSGAYKDLMSSWRDSSESEKALIQDLVDDVHEQFVAALQESRSLKKEQANAIADGRVFSGQQALKHGLVDQLGGFNEALAFIGQMSGLGDDPVIIQKSTDYFGDFIQLFQTQVSALVPSWTVFPNLQLR